MHAHAGKIPAPGTASSLSPSSSARLLLGICGCARVNEYEQRKRPAKTTDFCTRPHMCLLAGTALPQRHLEVRLQRHVLTSACSLLGGEKKILATTGAPACTHHACRSGKARQAHGQCVCPLPVPSARHTTHSAFSARLGFCASAAALPTPPATLLFCPASPLAPAQGLCPETSCTAYGLAAKDSARCGLLTAPPFAGANRREGHGAEEKEGRAQDFGHRCELSGQ